MTYEVSEHSRTIANSPAFYKRLQTTQAQVCTMQQCIDTAQVHNKNLQMSRNIISIGEQREKEAKANLIPKVTANADYNISLICLTI